MLDPTPIETPKVTEFTDNHGTVFTVGQLLGGGIEGRVFEGKIKSLGPHADPRLKVGDSVAIKQQPLFETASMPVERKKEILQREIDLLEKEGSLFGNKAVKVEDREYMYIAIPKLKGTTLRDQMYVVEEPQGVTGKRPLTSEQKKSICYQLLKDYAAQQLLGILHVDIKPDNMLFDPQTGKVKVIDFGNGFDRDRYSEHPEGFQSPGELYAAPENYGFDVKRSELKCSVKADEYAIAILMASLWTQCCYEKDADTTGKGNYALMARRVLEKDILNPNGQKPDDMPEDLWRIIRHLAAIDPNQRPENIFQADGINTSPNLKVLAEIHEQVERARKDILDNIGHNMSVLAQGEGKDSYKRYTDTQGIEGTQVVQYFDRFMNLYKTMDNLRDIAANYETVDSRSGVMNPRKERIVLTDEFEKIIKEMANSGDEHYQKIFKDAVAMEGTPDQKMRFLEEQSKKYVPKMLDKAYSQYSLHAYAELKVKLIVNGTHDIADMRIQLMNLYGDLIRMATHDSKYSMECRAITQVLDSIVNKLDDIRTQQAQMLQGRQVQPQPIPHVLPPMAAPIIQRKRSYWQRFKDAYKEYKSGTMGKKPEPTSSMDANPLMLSQRLNSLLTEPTPKTTSDQTISVEPPKTKPLPEIPKQVQPNTPTVSVMEVPKTFNPLSLSRFPIPMPKPQKQPHIPQSEFVANMMAPLVERSRSLITEYRNIKTDENTEPSVKFAQQKRKDALVIEMAAINFVMEHLTKNPGITKESSADLAQFVDKVYSVAQQDIKAVAISQGVGDYNNPAYGMTGKTSQIFNDMKQDLRQAPPQQQHARHQLT